MSNGNGATGAGPAASPRAQLDRLGASPLGRESILRDLAEDPASPGSVMDDGASADSETGAAIPPPSGNPLDLATSYRRGDSTATGNRTTIVSDASPTTERGPTPTERHEAWREERSLLRDNNIIPPKHPQQGDDANTFGSKVKRSAPFGVPGGDRQVVSPGTAEADAAATDGVASRSEATPLLGNPERPYGGQADDGEALERRWEDSVLAGLIKTTWQRETKVLGRYTIPLVFSQLLGFSLLLSPVLALGHLGTVELGAMSLGAMTANITGYTVLQSLATALDTLCAQAYGSGRKDLVGLQLQRMLCFLSLVLIPIAAVWLCSPWILQWIVPEPETAELASTYLRIAIIGMPGLVAYECGNRYLQAQGIFTASLYVNFVIAPANAFLVWLFVWHLGWGFVGAPIASVAINLLRALILYAYIYFRTDGQCWPGFTRRAFQNWGPMVRLALSGLLMVEAETLALEIVTLLSSYFGTTALAAQSVLTMTASVAWQIAFPLSIAMSTRIANLIGASLPQAARTTAKVGMSIGLGIALFNFLLLSVLRDYVPRLFSSDPQVWAQAAAVLPLCATMALLDSLATNLNGILRGLGRQQIGGYVNLVSYYVIAMPISLSTAFLAGWKLHGLWTGITVALLCVTVIESVFIYRTSWDKSVEDAQRRNEAG